MHLSRHDGEAINVVESRQTHYPKRTGRNPVASAERTFSISKCRRATQESSAPLCCLTHCCGNVHKPRSPSIDSEGAYPCTRLNTDSSLGNLAICRQTAVWWLAACCTCCYQGTRGIGQQAAAGRRTLRIIACARVKSSVFYFNK